MLRKFVDIIIKDNRVDEDLFIKIIDLSPNPNDSSFLNNLIREVQIWKIYQEDFEEEVEFPIEAYYNSLINK